MKRQVVQERVSALIKEYERLQAELQERYEAKWYLADTAKEHLAINEWHDAESAKLNTWYGKKLAIWLAEPIED